jgi:hypothetical protein
MKTSEQLVVGNLYSRKDLELMFGIRDASLKTGIFRPSGHESVWLFVTEQKSSDRTQYEDRLEGDDLFFDGQTLGRTDALIRDHEQLGLELLLFHRQKKDEFPNYAFRFEGPFRFFDARGSRPTKFHLVRDVANRLERVESVEDIRQNIRRFNSEARFHIERARALAAQTSYWIFDAESGLFGPSKFVGFKGMTFTRYERAVRGEKTGSAFDGGVTSQANEAVLGEFKSSDELSEQLGVWMNTILRQAVDIPARRDRWKFTETSDKTGYISLVCNPDIFDGLRATTELDEINWLFDRGNAEVGDRVLIWQAKGSGTNRGVIGLGEVISPPSDLPASSAEAPYWKKPPLESIRRQVKLRLFHYPNLPLWESEHQDLFSNLEVARARGGTVFSLAPDMWRRISELAGKDAEPVSTPDEPRRSSRQGFGLDPEARRAVELYAQAKAEDFFLQNGFDDVRDVSRTNCFDLLCRRGQDELRVEVKGTTGEGEAVILTKNEVEHARNKPGSVALFVVRRIKLERQPSGVTCSGGEIISFWPWDIGQGELKPLSYEYRLPRNE